MKRTMIQRMGKSTAALLLAAAVSVGFLQGAMTQPVSAEAAELSDFEAVFDAYSTKRNVWDDFFNWPKPEPVAAADFTKYWTVNADGMLESTGGGKLNLLYTKEKYTDFTMTFRYKHGPDENGAAHLYVGIGAPESGATLGAKGELLDPSPTLLRIYQVGNYQYAPTSEGEDDWYGPGNLFNDETAKNAVHTVTISVTGSTMTMKVDGQPLGALALTNYEGGHIFFGAGMTVDAIGLPEIEDTTPTNDFDGFSSYYTERVGSDKLVSAKLTDYWIEDEGAISRDAQTISGEEGQDWDEKANHLNNMAYLFIEGEYTDYENYTVELDYTMGSGAWRRAYIGFGATENVTWREENGGSVFFTDGGGATCFEGNMNENGEILRSEFGTTLESFNADASHHLKLTFQDGSITVEVDGQVVRTLENKAYYAGGRIFLASNSTGTVFRNITITEYTNDFDDFTAYYSENITSGDENAQDLQEVSPTDYWTEDNGKIVRRNVPHPTDATDNLYIASLFYNAQEYQNFELEADVTAGTNYRRRAFIGFGADMGKHYQQAGGGIAVFMDNGANGVWLNQCGNLGNDDGNFSRDGWGNFYEGLSLNDTQHLRLVMQDRILSVYVNEDPTPTKFLMPDWYDGGYIYFASNSTGASFANIKIKEIPGGAPAGSQNSHLYGKGALFIGDSISYGAEDTPKGYAWAGRIGFNYAMDWINASRGGATVARHPDSGIPQISDQLDYGYVGGRTIDYVIIEGGINDALRHQENEAACPLGAISESTDPEDFDQNTFAGALESLLCEIKARYPGAKIGYITTYQCPGWISVDKSGDYMELAKVICDKWGVPYLDLHENAELNAKLADCLPDKLHIDQAGYDIVTPLIEEFMLQISHTYDQKNTHAQYLKSEATCAKKAVYYYSCTCGKAGESTFESGETLPHTPAEKWSSDDNGHWHVCAVCGTKMDEAAHNPGAAATEDTPQTCTVCGYELAPATGHVNHVADTSKWLHDGTRHWHKCQGCDEKMDAAAHSGGEATCEEKAECAVCGVEYGELADHSYEDWVIVREATETANGLKERTCTVCGEKESEEIPATGETPDTNPEPGDKIPQTGENVPWIVLATAILASVVSVGSLLIQRKRKQKGI